MTKVSKVPKVPKVPCAGVIVFDTSCESDEIKTVLVKTERGNCSYPKGKRKKGEEDLETALRELEEETGITPEQITLVEDVWIDELSNKGNPNVRYFVGIINDPNHKFTFDSDELESVDWHTKEQLYKLEKLKKARKDVFTKAMDKIDLILNKLEMMESEMKTIKQEILEIKEQTTKMDHHVDFIDDVYERVKHPLDFVVSKYNSLVRITSEVDEERDLLNGIPQILAENPTERPAERPNSLPQLPIKYTNNYEDDDQQYEFDYEL
jgi:8-oxo-dGTP pyrophosphatase MutT (NUDIX family)